MCFHLISLHVSVLSKSKVARGLHVYKKFRLHSLLTLFHSSVTATAAAVGGAGVPQGGIGTMTLVLMSVGLPIDGITFVVAVDWIL